MDDLNAFRAEVAEFLESAVPEDQRFKYTELLFANREATQDFQAKLHARGWAAPRQQPSVNRLESCFPSQRSPYSHSFTSP